MTDVLKIALDRRAEVHEEIARLDEFIRTAETLMRTDDVKGPGGRRPATTSSADDDEAESTDIPRPGIIRRGA